MIEAFNICNVCNRRTSSHGTSVNGVTSYRCCKCFVEAGNPPCDWHSLCLETYANLNKKEGEHVKEQINGVDIRATMEKKFSYPPDHPQFHVIANTQDWTIKLSGNIILKINDPEHEDIVSTFMSVIATAEHWLLEQPGNDMAYSSHADGRDRS